MTWEIEYTDDFGIWWEGLGESEQVSVDVSVGLLEEKGPDLGYPHSSNIQDSQLAHLRELANPIGCFTRSTLDEWRYCFLAGKRPATIVGTKSIFQKRRSSTQSFSKN